MINPAQLRELIIRPVLLELAPEIPYSIAAENLIIGTGAVESEFRFVKQHPTGPALGIFQMEPATFRWLWDDWLENRPAMKQKFLDIVGAWRVAMPEQEMVGNLYFASAMCRLRYWVAPEKLPDDGDIRALARYWKRWYNTEHGKGSEDDFVERYAMTFERRAARSTRDFF